MNEADIPGKKIPDPQLLSSVYYHQSCFGSLAATPFKIAPDTNVYY
jgi:hypothetical protein